ncbi:uncharacterized protein BCR38DRAFT_342343, partial [Pseudomassariella vexata]
QITELYSACRFIYFKHPVDRSKSYGRPGHYLTRRTLLVVTPARNTAKFSNAGSSNHQSCSRTGEGGGAGSGRGSPTPEFPNGFRWPCQSGP